MSGKRRVLTTDDLLRLQEDGPARKRRREEDLVDSAEEDSDSELDLPAPRRMKSVEDEDDTDEASGTGSSGSEGEEDPEGAEQDSDSEAAAPRPNMHSLPEDDDDLTSSRITIAPRTPLAVPRKPLTAAPLRPTSFAEMGISQSLLIALSKMSIRNPTEIQAACIPPLLEGRDCIGNAKTGSGKTIAFALPIIQRLSVDPYGIFALVLTPTRELAFQISEQFAVLGAAYNVRTAVVVGGMDIIAQAIELSNRPHVIVATPGRLVDLLRSNNGEWDLSRVKFLVLDEADRMLTPTFAPELSYLFEAIPKERQTCLFTATWTPSIETIADAPPKPGKQKPFVHRMTETVETVATLKQYYLLVPSHVREAYLYYLLRNPPESTLHLRRAPPEPAKGKKAGKGGSKPGKAPKKKKKGAAADADDEEVVQPPPTVIFCAHPRTAAYLTALLKTLRVRATALHSRLTQRERLSSLGLFRASVVPVLVSTDVGARGLDFADVAMVVNWDMPGAPEEYTHRVGRTARAGRGGVAVSFVTERDEERVVKIEERIKTKLEEMSLPEEKVLETLNAVSTAKRLANMELHDSDFGKREEIHKIKRAKRKADIAES